jgi:hypothetical protein
VEPIRNAQYKNCLAVATGDKGFDIDVYAFTNKQFQDVGNMRDVQSSWWPLDINGDNFDEIQAYELDPNSQDSDEKYILATYVWNRNIYDKLMESANVDAKWGYDVKSNNAQVFKPYESEKGQYDINLPAGWDVKEGEGYSENGTSGEYTDVTRRDNGLITFRISAYDNDGTDPGQTEEKDILNYAAKRLFDNAKVNWTEIDSGTIHLNGEVASFIDCRGEKKDEDRLGLNAIFMAMITEQKIYILSYEGDMKGWEDNKITVKKAFLSFTPYLNRGTFTDEYGNEVGLD